MTEPQIYELTEAQWTDDMIHRSACMDPYCGRFAHIYVRAIAEGRVKVDGEVVRPPKRGDSAAS